MKTVKSLLFGIVLSLPVLSWQQSNDCSTATALPVTANCSSPTNGTTIGATQSIAGCSGTSDDDVWYQFTATATSHQITVVGSATFDAVVQVFSGACASLASLSCTDLTFNGGTETVYLSGLSIGQVYRVRVYHYSAGSGSGTFTICCTVGASAPSNNNCSGATALTVNTSCVNTAGTTLGATQSVAGCSGTADDDVWYSFVATNASQTITVTPTTSTFDAVFQVYSGTCASLSTEACIDNTFSNDPETSTVVGLTPGQTYYVRVYDYYSSNPGTFNICITGPATAVPTNDNPCSAIALPAVTSNCNYLEFTTVGATNTASPGAPSSCIGGSGAANGGFSAGTLDVWFSIVVPSSGTLFITPKPNMGAGRISDGVMVLYSGTCGSLTQITCADDNNFPGTSNDLLPFISATGLTPGSTVYLRFFGYGTSSGTFGLCITTASNDACSNALYICDLNGYSASTSAAFTPDRPCNMRGNAEQNNAPTYTYTPGTNQGGIFGSVGAWGTGSASPDVQINNNSWIRFTAASATAVLNVSVSDCWVGNYPSGGIQMQVFSSNGACCNFTPVSNFEENSTSFTITANGLTPGNDYYLMVDGFAGDICNYTITAQSGVQFPEITPVAPICAGQSVNLNAPLGGTSYYWIHNGAITSSVNVTPATTQNYSVDVYGICGYKQTLTTTVTVNPIPTAPLLSANQTVCTGNTLNLTANTISGATYSWSGPNGFTSSLQNPSISNVSSAAAGVYTCYVTVSGCTSPNATTTVTVNTTPAPPVISSNTPVCSGNTINLFSNTIGSATYAWTGPSSFSSSLEDPTRPSATTAMSGTYTLQITVNGCPNSATTNVVVNPTPATPTAGSNSAICAGQTLNLTASNVVGATSYSWTGPNSFASSSQNPSIGSATTAATGTYTVTASGSGCTSSAGTVNVTVNPIPATPVISSNSPVCTGQTINLFSNTIGSATYSWTGPSGFTSALEDPTRGSAVAGFAGIYSLTVSVSGCSSSAATTNVVVNPIPASPTAGSNGPVCSGNTINLSASTVPSASGYTWSGPNSFSSTVQNPSITSSTTAMSGIYSVTATVNGCTSTAGTVNVVVNATPVTPSPTSNGPICEGSTVNLSQATVGSATYSWTGPNSFVSTNEEPSFANGQAINAGTYNVTVTVNGCTSGVGSTVLAVNTAAQVDAGANLASCNGATVNLAGSIGGSASSVTWSNGGGSFSNINSATSTYTPSAGEILAGSVILTLTTDNPTGPCPAVSDVVTIAISSSPSASFSYPNPSYCQSSSDPTPVFPVGASGGVFSSTAGLSINASSGAIDVSASTPGIYTVQNNIAANGSCPSANASTSFEVIATPATPSVSNNGLICENGTIQLSGPTVSGTYSWSGPNSFTSTLEDPSISNAGSAEAGTYGLVVTVNGCPSATGTTNVVVTPNPNVSITNGASANVCTNDVLTLTATGANSFVWSTTEITSSINVTGTSNTTYTVTGTTAGCSSTDQINIIVNSLPSLTTSPTANNSNCDNPTGSLIGIVVNGAPTIDYLWHDGLGNNVGVNADLSNVDAGNYTVDVTDGNGCQATFGPFTVSNFPTPTSPTVNFDDASPCINNAITGSTSTVAGGSYAWTGPNGFSNATSSFTIDPVLLSNTGSYCVTVTVNGCPSNPGCADLTVNALPIVDIDGNNTDSTVCFDTNIVLTATGATSFTWTGPNSYSGNGATVTLTNVTSNNAGYYYVTGMSGQNCSATDSVLVTVNPLPSISLNSNSTNNNTFCQGGMVELTATGSGTLNWAGPNGFTSSNDTITFDPATNNQSGSYAVTITDGNGCMNADTIAISISSADFGGISGPNELCAGQTLILTATGGGTYSWAGPNLFASTNASITIPTFTQNQEGNYIVQITDSLGCITSDTNAVSILHSSSCLDIPELVTPDGNGFNDTWDIEGLEYYPDAEVFIYNRWGNLIYQVSPYTTPWNGEPNNGLTIDGKSGKVPFGTYFYQIKLNDSEKTEYKGYLELQY